MPYPQIDRSQLQFLPLAKRESKLRADRDCVRPGDAPRHPLTPEVEHAVNDVAARIRQARARGAPVILAFGAHTVKNGLGPLISGFLESGWVQHLATNGAGIIHDWEFAFHGGTSEDVRKYIDQGQFGLWQEAGHHLNLALLLGAYDGLGYGEAVGRLIETGRHHVPARAELLDAVKQAGGDAEQADRAAAAADLLAAMTRCNLEPGVQAVPHPWKSFSLQAAAYRLQIPFTAHPMIGHDIIYAHPLNACAALGRAAQRDFLTYAHQVARLAGGVYLSIGSAVMSPMIFEKSLAMARNLARQAGKRLDSHFILVSDLAESSWDWAAGEPPPERPEYYLRYCKTFSRMGGTMRYVSADNRDLLPALYNALDSQAGSPR